MSNLNEHDTFSTFGSRLNALEHKPCGNDLEHVKMCVKGKLLKSLEHQWKQPLNYISTNLLNLEIQAELNQLNIDNVNEFNANVEKAVQRISNDISFYNKLYQSSNSKNQFELCDIVNNYFHIIQHKIRNNDIQFEYQLLKNSKETLYNYESENALIIVLFLNIIAEYLIQQQSKQVELEVRFENNQFIFSLNQLLKEEILFEHYHLELYLIKLLTEKTSLSLENIIDNHSTQFILSDKGAT